MLINLAAFIVAVGLALLALLALPNPRKHPSCEPQDILVKPGETITIVGRDGSVIHVTGEH